MPNQAVVTEDASACGVLVITADQARHLAAALGPILAAAREKAALDPDLAEKLRAVEGLRRMLARAR